MLGSFHKSVDAAARPVVACRCGAHGGDLGTGPQSAQSPIGAHATAVGRSLHRWQWSRARYGPARSKPAPSLGYCGDDITHAHRGDHRDQHGDPNTHQQRSHRWPRPRRPPGHRQRRAARPGILPSVVRKSRRGGSVEGRSKHELVLHHRVRPPSGQELGSRQGIQVQATECAAGPAPPHREADHSSRISYTRRLASRHRTRRSTEHPSLLRVRSSRGNECAP
jgi:hypothetical protein